MTKPARKCGTCGNVRRLEFTLGCPINCNGGDFRVVRDEDACNNWRGLSQRNAAKLKGGSFEPPTPTEEQEQDRLIVWCNEVLGAYPELEWIFHVPNGGLRNKPEAFRFKKAGVKKGVPDLFLLEPRGNYHGLVVELKRIRGGVVSPEQKVWLSALNTKGYRAVVCYGADAAIREIKNYLNQKGDLNNEL
jgi:hypothetical protein